MASLNHSTSARVRKRETHRETERWGRKMGQLFRPPENYSFGGYKKSGNNLLPLFISGRPRVAVFHPCKISLRLCSGEVCLVIFHPRCLRLFWQRLPPHSHLCFFIYDSSITCKLSDECILSSPFSRHFASVIYSLSSLLSPTCASWDIYLFSRSR